MKEQLQRNCRSDHLSKIAGYNRNFGKKPKAIAVGRLYDSRQA